MEDGGVFHTPVRDIPRGSALSPLLAAFHLTETDRDFEGHRQVTYVRYMDDFLLFARTRWHLRKAVSQLNRHLSAYGFEQHPDKTFIGRVEKGFDWMGFWFTEKGRTSVAPRALNNFLTKLCRLYERTRHQPAGGGLMPGGEVCQKLAVLVARHASGLSRSRALWSTTHGLHGRSL